MAQRSAKPEFNRDIQRQAFHPDDDGREPQKIERKRYWNGKFAVLGLLRGAIIDRPSCSCKVLRNALDIVTTPGTSTQSWHDRSDVFGGRISMFRPRRQSA